MRTVGLGGEFADKFSMTWSNRDGLKSVEEMSGHLKKIMKAEKKMHKPTKPPAVLPTRRSTTVIGTLTDEVKMMDKKYFSEVEKFEQDTDKLRQEM